MRLQNHPLSFIHFVDNRNEVNPKVREKVLGTEWKARTEPDMVRHAVSLLQYGYSTLASCKDIITRINNLRNKISISNVGLGIRPVHFVLHDEISGFDSEAGSDKCGVIAVNMCTRAAWLDKNGLVWYVPVLLIIYHELGHYLQYLSNSAEYERAAKHEEKTGMHLLDAMNLPDNEYPICREIGMGRRELYTDMHELEHADFRGRKLNYSRLPRDKAFKLAVEPEDVRKKREAQEKLDLEKKGVQTGGGSCKYCSEPFLSTVKKIQHEQKCPKKGH